MVGLSKHLFYCISQPLPLACPSALYCLQTAEHPAKGERGGAITLVKQISPPRETLYMREWPQQTCTTPISTQPALSYRGT